MRRTQLRIAFVTGHYRPFAGGVETHVERIARHLVALGDDVTVLTQADHRSWPAHEVIDGVDVRRYAVPLPSRHLAVSPSLMQAIRLDRRHFDVVHAHGYHSSAPLLAALAGARPLVLTPHYHGTGHSPLRKALHLPYRRLGALVVRAARRVICVSESERLLFLGHFARAGPKTSVIPNGVDLDALRAATPFPEDRTIVLSAGRLEVYKHVEITLRAMALLDDNHRLVITGDGPERPRLEALSAQLGLQRRAQFVGRVDVDVLYRWYRSSAVYVTMSSNEAMPVTILELLACGAHVVASDIPAHRELATRVGGPVTLVPFSPDAVAEAIVRSDMTRLSREPQVPTWADVAEATRHLYGEVLDGN